MSDNLELKCSGVIAELNDKITLSNEVRGFMNINIIEGGDSCDVIINQDQAKQIINHLQKEFKL